MSSLNRIQFFVLTTVFSAVLAGCSSSPRVLPPVEDRMGAGRTALGGGTTSADAVKALPGSENAGKPGYYTVQRGDTLMRIGLDNGQAWRDLARWNSLSNPDVIEVGQVLRVAPPGAAVSSATDGVLAFRGIIQKILKERTMF